MKKSTYIFALMAAAFLTACGGGGGADSGPSTPTPTPPPVVVTPPVATITNPLTGAAAPGSPTKTISGIGVPGATVTAYAVNADGSSGAVLGTAATNPVGGEFTISTTDAPMAWVRFVSRGGKYDRKSDNSPQPVESMELVTPFITTSYNNFKITPVSDIAARILTFKAKTGSTLVDAFKFGMTRVLQLDSANLTLQNDPAVYLNVLKGRVQGESYSAFASPDMAELSIGIDRFGIMYDLPSNQVWRVIAAAGENSYPLATVDGVGAAINTGAFVNGTFDANAVMSLKTLMNAKTLDELKVTDNAGVRVAPKVSDMISRHIIQEYQVHHACQFGVGIGFTDRNPFFPLVNGKIADATCTDVARRMADFFTRMESNKSRFL
jgi:hypothetical protein